MCRSCEQGGRRCPSDAPERRRARQNAAYHAKKHTRPPRTPESGSDDATSTAGLAPLSGPVTREMVAERVTHARETLDRLDGEALTETNKAGWLQTTPAGLEAEAATRAAGAAVAARADELAASRMGEDFVAVPGYSSREEYVEYVHLEAERLKEQIGQIQRDAMNSTDPAEMKRLINEGNALVNKTNELLREDARNAIGDGAWDRAESSIYSGAYLQALSEQRSMGLPDGQMIEVDPKSQKATVQRLEKGLAHYPSDWLARDGEHETQWQVRGGLYESPQDRQGRIPLRVKSTSRRAHYAPVVQERRYAGRGEEGLYSELTIDKRDEGCLGPGVSTAVHEYGHRAEAVQPKVNDLAQVHLARRTSTSDGQRHELEPYLVSKQDRRAGPPATMDDYTIWRSKNSEWLRSDDFAERYTGKQNSSSETSSEVFSTGMEGVFAGRFGGLRGAGRWKADQEHRDFILGTLAAVR